MEKNTIKKIIFFLLFLPIFSFGQIPGCTDDIACNYSPNATFDDGSCIYVSNPIIDLTQQTWALGIDGEENSYRIN